MSVYETQKEAIAVYERHRSARDMTNEELAARMETKLLTAEEQDEIEYRLRTGEFK